MVVFHGKTIGKPQENGGLPSDNGGLMMVEWDKQTTKNGDFNGFYPLVMTNIAMVYIDGPQKQMAYLLKMVIFHGYVK